jgi:hypothetical protein
MDGARMEFYQKYELLDLLKDEGVKVFNAREISTGRRITVFLFAGEQARLHAELLEQLRVLQRPDRNDLLEVGDNQGIPFVVTEPLSGIAELKRKVAVSPAPPAAAAPPAPGEFTRLFQASAPPQPIREAAPPAQSATDEFTRLFQSSAPPRPIREAAPLPPPPLPPTRAPLPPPAAPSAQAGAGEFTRFFQSPLSKAPASEPVLPPPPAGPPQKPSPPAVPPSSAPGEFTRIFGRGDAPAAPPPPRAGGSATLSFRAQPKVTPPATAAPSAGPGEYTRMFSPTPVLRPQPPAPPVAQTPAPAIAPVVGKKVPLWLVLALGVAVVVLLAIVAIMALAPRK